MYDFLLTVHVLAAVLWVGGGATLHIAMRRAMKLSDAQQRHERLADFEWIGGHFYPIFSLAALIAGIFLVAREEGGFEFSDTFVTMGFVGWTISFLIGVGFYAREGKRREQLATEKGPDSPEVTASARLTANVNSFEMLVLILVVIAMTTKPGWP